MGKKLYTDNPICDLTHVSPSEKHEEKISWSSYTANVNSETVDSSDI